MKKYKVLDLFSGAGGMAEGFMQAGFDVAYATDISEHAEKTYVNRHKQLGYSVKFSKQDIVDFAKEDNLKEFLGSDFDKIDVICGGPPCQGFSLAGKREKDDARNLLVMSYIKILKIIKPKYFVMENVIGILSAQFEKFDGFSGIYTNEMVIDVIMQEFDFIGYHVKYKILEANKFGVPQKRKRVIFLGTKKNNNLVEPSFPKESSKEITVMEAIDDLKDIGLGSTITEYNRDSVSAYQLESRKGRTPGKNGLVIEVNSLFNHQTSRHSKKVQDRFSLINEGETMSSMFKRVDEELKQKYYTKKQNCMKLSASSSSITVMTLPDDMIHYCKNRILTVREMARLQSFDDSFEFLGPRTTGGKRRGKELPQYSLVGNAVPPLLAFAIAKELKSIL